MPSAQEALSASADDSLYVARQVWPSRSPGFSIDQKCQSSLRWRVFECEVSRSLHLPCRQLASWLGSLCARGGLGQRPTGQCWRRQARACRRLCVLSAWCLCASEEKRTRVAGIYSCITLLGIASPPGSWRLGGLPEMRRLLEGCGPLLRGGFFEVRLTFCHLELKMSTS